MSTYIITIILTVILSYMAESNATYLHTGQGIKERRKGNIFSFLAIGILVFVAGFRYYVGVDYYFYYHYRPQISNFANSIGVLKESGFYLLGLLARFIYDDGISLIFLASLITISLYGWTIYKYSPSFTLGMLLFILMGEWYGSFNGVRQYLASAIIFAGHRYIVDKQLRKYLLVVCIAFSFHVTSIIMLVPYFLYRRKPDIKQFGLLLLFSIVVRYSYNSLFSAIGTLKETEMLISDNSYYYTSVNILRVAVAVVPIGIFFFLCDKKDIYEEEYPYFNALFFNGFCMIAAGGSTYLARVGIYTAPMTIIGYSYMLSHIRDDRIRSIILFSCIVLYLVYFRVQIGSTGFLWWF